MNAPSSWLIEYLYGLQTEERKANPAVPVLLAGSGPESAHRSLLKFKKYCI